VAAGLLIETRLHLAAIDTAHRAALGQQVAHHQASRVEPSGRLRQFGRASLELADAALGILRCSDSSAARAARRLPDRTAGPRR
jgi:hypothetical protein